MFTMAIVWEIIKDRLRTLFFKKSTVVFIEPPFPLPKIKKKNPRCDIVIEFVRRTAKLIRKNI